jgi:hypothetical protein
MSSTRWIDQAGQLLLMATLQHREMLGLDVMNASCLGEQRIPTIVSGQPWIAAHGGRIQHLQAQDQPL